MDKIEEKGTLKDKCKDWVDIITRVPLITNQADYYKTHFKPFT